MTDVRQIYTAILIVVLLVIWHFRSTTYVKIGNEKYNVASGYSNKAAAAKLIADMNENLIRFLRYLRAKYQNHPTEDVRLIVDSILKNYNPEVIVENDPKWSTDTSYTVDKGRKLILCLRQKSYPYNLVDHNTMMFVVLHEVGGHIGNYNGWQHTTRFWSIFKFIIYEAALFGIYTPIDYKQYPVKYCGIKIDYQPLYDHTLPDLWRTN